MSEHLKAQRPNIVLIGFMGTGKSVVGKALSRKLAVQYRDSDSEIERIAGMSIRELFELEGEAQFRKRETDLLISFAETHRANVERGRSDPFILSTGGGTPLLTANQKLLRQVGTVICLSTTPEIIGRRVSRHIDQRPLLAPYRNDPLARIRTLLEQRMPVYHSCADFTVETMSFDQPAQVADHIIKLLSLQ